MDPSARSSPRPRVLVLQLKRIGDAVLTAHALAAIRRHSDAAITLVVADAACGLADGFTAADEVFCYRRGRLNLVVWLRLVIDGFSHAVDLTGTDRSGLMTLISRAKVRAGPQRAAHANRRSVYTSLCDIAPRDCHTVDWHLAMARTAGLVRAKSHSRKPATADRALPSGFNSPPAAGARVAELLDADLPGAPPFAVIHPGTARAEKFWLPDRWAAVIDHLQRQRGLRVVLTGAGDDFETSHRRAIFAALEISAPPETRDAVVDLAGRLTLLELASLISRSRIAVGTDTAAMHLAAIAEVPQVTLFGPTNPFHWRGRHGRSLVVVPGADGPARDDDFASRAPGGAMRDVSTDAVIRAIDTLLAPAPAESARAR